MESKQDYVKTERDYGPYLVAPSFKSFETRHEAIGHGAILEREWNLEWEVVDFDEMDKMKKIDRVLDTLDLIEKVKTNDR